MNRVLFFEFIADCVSVIILDYSHNRIEDVPVLVVTHQKKNASSIRRLECGIKVDCCRLPSCGCPMSWLTGRMGRRAVVRKNRHRHSPAPDSSALPNTAIREPFSPGIEKGSSNGSAGFVYAKKKWYWFTHQGPSTRKNCMNAFQRRG